MPTILRRPSRLALVGLLFALGACGSSASTTASTASPTTATTGASTTTSTAASAPLKVVTSLNLLGDLIDNVGGTRVTVKALVPTGGDPHTYEATAGDAKALETADLVILNGAGLEDDWISKIIGVSTAKRPVVNATDGLEVRTLDFGDDAGKQDPHMWNDPKRAKAYVDNIKKALEARDPAGTATYEANATTYQQQLDSLITASQTELNTIPPKNRQLVTTHDAFSYLGADFGLTIVGSIFGSVSTEGADPSAKSIAKLVDDIKAVGVPTIFIETIANPKVTEQIAASAGVKIGDELYADGLGDKASGADTYVTMIRHNIGSITRGLGGTAP